LCYQQHKDLFNFLTRIAESHSTRQSNTARS